MCVCVCVCVCVWDRLPDFLPENRGIKIDLFDFPVLLLFFLIRSLLARRGEVGSVLFPFDRPSSGGGED